MMTVNITNTTETTFEICQLPQVYYVIVAVIGSFAFLLNATLLFVLWKNKSPTFRQGTSYVIGNLALADSLTGVAIIIFASCNSMLVKFQLSMIWTTIEASLMSLVFLSIERVIAVCYPLTCKIIVSVKRTIVTLCVIWIFAFSCGVFITLDVFKTQFALTIVFEVCVVVFVASQAYIILKMGQRKRSHLVCDSEVSSYTRKYLQTQRTNDHVTTVVFLLVVIMVVTILPHMVATQIFLLSAVKFRSPLDVKTQGTLRKFISYYLPIELLNFIVNPIVYAYRLRRYREAFIKTFSFKKTRDDSKVNIYDREINHSKRLERNSRLLNNSNQAGTSLT